MHFRKYLLLLICSFGLIGYLGAQNSFRRIDTTMKVGKVGYRLTCSNKNPEKNTASISPVGFDKNMREFSFEIKGRVSRAEVDDVNRDGYPDLVFYTYTNDSIPRGNVVAISSEKNESVAPIFLPDIYDDPKLRVGYKGNDEYFLMEGTLIRRFPVYPAEGTPAPPTSGTLMRQIQYIVVPGERGAKFKAARSYEYTKQ
ncbi:MAG: hypothetical protein IM584_02090 [Chitinophagaceae bacterium]|nr:hypothetical protein [Chitinophagaceae bacterium]MEA3426871.1 hypothetical protein [Bacteroidota bacterium]MCA6453905.1 hypothetical protein [Chitinophagaceae bacterium]MCA6454904.1 hypothetical protein [Chitinophagaceae bacterium]MCA6458699.1 hypothetical protein [Chitinophagaceae bacterium]